MNENNTPPNLDDMDLDDNLPYLTASQAEEKVEETGRAVHYIDAHTHQPSCVAPEFEHPEDEDHDHPGMGELGGNPNEDPEDGEDV